MSCVLLGCYVVREGGGRLAEGLVRCGCFLFVCFWGGMSHFVVMLSEGSGQCRSVCHPVFPQCIARLWFALSSGLFPRLLFCFLLSALRSLSGRVWTTFVVIFSMFSVGCFTGSFCRLRVARHVSSAAFRCVAVTRLDVPPADPLPASRRHA